MIRSRQVVTNVAGTIAASNRILSQTFYTGLGKVNYTLDENGNKTVYDYDQTGNAVQTSVYQSVEKPDPQNPAQTIMVYEPLTVTQTLYDKNDRVIVSVTAFDAADPTAEPTGAETVYDALGRTIKTRQWNNVRLNLQRFKINLQAQKVFEGQAGYASIPSAPVGMSIPSTITAANAWDTAVQGTPPAGQQIGWTAEGVLPEAGHEASRSETVYDTAGRVWKTYAAKEGGALVCTNQYVYDTAGRILQVIKEEYKEDGTLGLALMTQYDYDDLGRLETQTAVASNPADNLTTTFAYDGLNRKTLTTDPKNIQTQYVYNMMGHLYQKIEDSDTGGMARTTTYHYDRLGNMTSIVANDGTNNQTTEYEYDLLGRVDYIDYPDDTYIDYTYSDAGKVEEREQGDTGSSVTTLYTYDGRGNLLSKYEDGSSIHEVYTYDGRGLMKTAKKGDTGDYTNISYDIFAYNDLGYMTSASQSIKGGTAKTVYYTRDQLGQATQLTIPTATPVVLNYTYTSLGQINTITRGEETLVNYSYMGTYVTGRSYATTSVVNFTPQYDKFGRVTRRTTVNGSGAGVDFEYPSYDKNGNILSQVYHHRNQQTPPANGLTYDDLNRLTDADYQVGTAGTESFIYDLLGNRIPQTGNQVGYTDTRPNPDVTCSYEHNLANEYTSVCGTTVLYDAAGNLTRDKNGYSYAYDYENRLTQIARPDDTVVATFEYDALGRRIEKVDAIAGTTTRFYYDDQRIVLQTSVSGTETDSRYFIFGNYIDEVLIMRNLIGTPADYYYGHDHLYSPVALFESDGDLVERYEYDVYGKVRIFGPGTDGVYFTTDDEYRSVSAYGNPYYFTGRELDSFDNNALKLMYYRARSYDPQTGRFLQRDPKQYIDGMNLYEYVKNCPVNYNDPSGLLVDNPWNGFLSYIFGKGQAERLGDGFFSHFQGSDSYKEMIENLRDIGQRNAECDRIVTYPISLDYSGVVTADLNWNYDPVLNFAIGTIAKVSITGDCSVSCGKIQRIKEGCCCRCVMRCKAHFYLFNNYNWNGDNNIIFRLLGMHLVGTPYDMTGDFDVSIRRSLVKCP